MTLQTIFVSAPGKVILFGEHAVVYGKRALATSLNLRTRVKLVEGIEETIVLKLPELNEIYLWKLSELKSLQSSVEPLLDRLTDLPFKVDNDVLEKIKHFIDIPNDSSSSQKHMAVSLFLYLLFAVYHKSTLPRLSIEVHTALPLGAGLGSSASYSVSLAVAFLTHNGNIQPKEVLSVADKEMINRWSLLAEMVVHGNPSGIDNCVVTQGRAVEFKCGQMTLMENMPELKILLVDTKVPRSTKRMVANVKAKRDKYLAIVNPLLQGIEEVTTEALKSLQCIHHRQTNDMLETDNHLNVYSTLNDLIELNQGLLRCLGVSHAAIEVVLCVLQKHGLYGKLTGGGGGGCVFSILPPDFPLASLQRVRAELETQKFVSFESCIGVPGVEVSVV